MAAGQAPACPSNEGPLASRPGPDQLEQLVHYVHILISNYDLFFCILCIAFLRRESKVDRTYRSHIASRASSAAAKKTDWIPRARPRAPSDPILWARRGARMPHRRYRPGQTRPQALIAHEQHSRDFSQEQLAPPGVSCYSQAFLGGKKHPQAFPLAEKDLQAFSTTEKHPRRLRKA